NGICTTDCGNTALAFLSVIFSVWASMTSICWICLAWLAAPGTGVVLGSAMRTQLNFTAAASYGVPSVNLMLGLILRVHTTASDDVRESAIWPFTCPSEVSVYIRRSNRAR